MATSTNYLWTEPNDSDLVKNGASAMRTLGNAIDVSLWNSGFGQAGKNKIINGDFGINQRAFTSVTADNSFCFDRWQLRAVDGTVTATPQVFTLGSAPVSGYGGTNYLQTITTGQTLTTARASNGQNIENVRLLAGQTVTVSLWAKAATGTPNVAVEMTQIFGTGGSPSATVTGILASTPKQAISTSWARYSWTISVPSIAGKTIGTDANSSYTGVNIWFSAGSSFDARTGTLGIQSNTFQIWGVQVEYGSTSTPFQTASGGSPQAELAMCQRYYWRTPSSEVYSTYNAFGLFATTTSWQGIFVHPVQMRVKASSIDFATPLNAFDGFNQFALTNLAITSNQSTPNGTYVSGTVSGATAFRPAFVINNNNASSYVGFSAEL